MKLTLVLLSLVICFGTYCCPAAEKTNEQASTQSATKESTANLMAQDTLTNRQGVKLVMAYDNDRHTATFLLAGETINLQQDTLASGIKY